MRVSSEALAKGEMLGVEVLTLEKVLSYGKDDKSEGTFEVSMCSEALREMLDTRFGRGLLRSLPLVETKACSLCAQWHSCQASQVANKE